MQGDDFGAQEVVAGGDVGGDFYVDWWEGGGVSWMVGLGEGVELMDGDGDGLRWGGLHTSTTAVLHVFDAPPIVVTSPIIRRAPRIRKHLKERRAPIRRPRIRHLAHVNIHGSPMGASDRRRLQARESARPVAGLLVHFDGHRVAGFDGTSARYGAAVDVAADVVGGDVLQGVVGGGHADAGFALVDAVDPEVLEGGVGGDLGY